MARRLAGRSKCRGCRPGGTTPRNLPGLGPRTRAAGRAASGSAAGVAGREPGQPAVLGRVATASCPLVGAPVGSGPGRACDPGARRPPGWPGPRAAPRCPQARAADRAASERGRGRRRAGGGVGRHGQHAGDQGGDAPRTRRGARTVSTGPVADVLRPHAEQQYAAELAALADSDDRQRPRAWRMSPWAVVTYVLGGTTPDGTEITPKYIGSRRLVEVAVATLATDRALLLLGAPGTAKTWLSEHLAAAISGDSTLLVQGTAGTSEDAVRYGWNYARLIAEGPTPGALVPSPVMTAMRAGQVVRIEELTRMPAEVQDALITVVSEKTLPVPELGTEVQAVTGFTLVATANDRDRGINEMSSALRRRFSTVVLPLPATEDVEVDIVTRRVAELGRALQLPAEPPRS